MLTMTKSNEINSRRQTGIKLKASIIGLYSFQEQNHNITYVYTAGIYHRSLDTNIHRKEQSV